MLHAYLAFYVEHLHAVGQLVPTLRPFDISSIMIYICISLRIIDRKIPAAFHFLVDCGQVDLPSLLLFSDL